MKFAILPNAFIIVSFCVALAHAVTIDTVPIGNPDNPADIRYDANGYGQVPNSFRIGKTEITDAQYVEFLNAVATSDPYRLYNALMDTTTEGGIIRSGLPGNFTYAVKGPALNGGYAYHEKPVGFVNWYSAIRFANWLHNGQRGPGTTEYGAYTLLGDTPIPSNASDITRNVGARWYLPSEDEWYKAAYYNSDAGVYYDYPTGTNAMPNNNSPSADTGNSANFLVGSIYPLTDAGAYTNSDSAFGTFDQGGNVWEWNETVIVDSSRGLRGGGYCCGFVSDLHAAIRSAADPWNEQGWIGFRVATTIPEPNALLLGALASVGLLLRVRRV